jgi:hypothetical protein
VGGAELARTGWSPLPLVIAGVSIIVGLLVVALGRLRSSS